MTKTTWLAVSVLWLATGCSTLEHVAGDMAGKSGVLLRGGLKAGAAQLPIGYEEERAYGGAIAVMVVDRYGGLDETPALNEYVQFVGHTVAAFSERPDIPYFFGILASDEVNAVSAPGGYVFVTRGALKACKDEAELAGILAHEVAHVSGRHALSIIRNLKTKAAMAEVVGDAWKDARAFSAVIDGFLNDFLERGLPQDTEHDADHRGTLTLQRIGWHPAGLRTFLARMQAQQASQAGQKFYKTHPDSAQRVARLDAQLAALHTKSGQVQDKRYAERVLAALTPPAPQPPPSPPSTPPPATEPTPALPPTR